MNHFIDKFKPIRDDELIGDIDNYNFIRDWIVDFNNKKAKILNQTKKRNNKQFSNLVIVGDRGIGKTTSIDYIIESIGYRKIVIDTDKLNIEINKMIENNKKKKKDKIIPKLRNNDIVSILMEDIQENIVFVIDDVEIFTMNKHYKTYISELQINNNSFFDYPLIFIGTSAHNKFIKNLMKDGEVITLNSLEEQDLKYVFDDIVYEYDINVSDEVRQIIVEHCNLDIRQLFHVMYLLIEYDSEFSMVSIINFFKTFNQKDNDYSIYSATEKLLYESNSFNNMFSLYENETTQIPLLIYDYYIDNILNNIVKDKQWEVMDEVISSLALGDIAEDLIFSIQSFNLRYIHAFYSTVYTSTIMDTYRKNTEMKKSKMKYASNVNKSSTRMINYKNILKAKQIFSMDRSVMDLLNMDTIIRRYIDENTIESIIDLFKNYSDFNIEFLESLLKINKISNSKITLTTKQKKFFV